MKINGISNISFKSSLNNQSVRRDIPVVAYPEFPSIYSAKNDTDVVDNGVVKGLVNKIAMVSDILFSKPIQNEANNIKASINQVIDTISCETSGSKLNVIA